MDFNHHENYIIGLIEKDRRMMEVLRAARGLDLPDWWLGAGFVRNKVWDTLHNIGSENAESDVDLIYYDPQDLSEKAEQDLELLAYSAKPGVPWSVKNQARMHLANGDQPYKSSVDALSQWVETATCVGVKLNNNNELVLAAPWGVEDIIKMRLRPNPHCRRNPQQFILRLNKKQWPTRWPNLEICYE